MCTVIYIPAGKKKYFASLRDENPARPQALVPQIYPAGEISYLCPADALAGGSWIGVNTICKSIVLLNGGFENHLKKSVYRQSRGAIVIALLRSEEPLIDWSLLDLNEIEPFTLILLDNEKLFELVWTGDQKRRRKMDATCAHIWSSSTLYDAEAKRIREALFRNWLINNPKITKFSLFNFFTVSSDQCNGFIINRNETIKTLSYTFLEISNKSQATMNYYDMQSMSYTGKTIKFLKATSATTCPLSKN
ncbi:MAG: NRDE family protein [Ferruginibacter sp.]